MLVDLPQNQWVELPLVSQKDRPRNMKNNLGGWGERVARWYLEKNGYKFIEANYRTRYGEIDLIVKSGGQVIFVEVKTRRVGNIASGNKGLPYLKVQRLESAIAKYVSDNSVEDWRAILISITKHNRKISIRITTI